MSNIQRFYPYMKRNTAANLMTFRALDFSSQSNGVDRLNPSLTINGSTETPKFRFNGVDANATGWAAWGYGSDTTRVSVATPPSYNQGSPLLGSNDDSVLFNSSDYYKNATSVNQITTGDIFGEVIYKAGPDAKYICSTLATNGFVLYHSTNRTAFYMNDDDGNVTVTSAVNSAINGTWVYSAFAINRDEGSVNGGQFYINGAANGTGVDMSAQEKTLTSTAFAIGADTNGTVPFNSNVAYLAIWEKDNWMQAGAAGQTEIAAIVAERFDRLCGVYPQLAKGTATPTVKTRAFAAYLDKIESGVRKLYYVGGEWLRICQRSDGTDTLEGYLSEPQCLNTITESEDFTTTWAKLDAGDTVTSNAAAGPDGRTVADSFTGDATDGVHGCSIAATLTAATYTFSVFAKPGDKDWIKLDDSTVANCTCYFDVANGTVGTAGAGATGYIEGPYLNSYYRCCIVFTGTAAAHTLKVQSAHADTDDDFAGDGSTKNTYVWGAQCELSDYMTSPIITDGGTATRLKDQLRYKGDDGNVVDGTVGSVHCDVLFPAATLQITRNIFSINDGGSSADRILGMYNSGVPNYYTGYMYASGGDAAGVSVLANLHDGTIKDLVVCYQTDNTFVKVNGTKGSTDTSCDVPNDLDQIQVGANISGNVQPSCLIRNFRIYRSVVESD